MAIGIPVHLLYNLLFALTSLHPYCQSINREVIYFTCFPQLVSGG